VTVQVEVGKGDHITTIKYDLVRRCISRRFKVVVDTLASLACATILKTLFRSSTQVRVDACLHQQHWQIGVEYK
jgi:hypothetical protein